MIAAREVRMVRRAAVFALLLALGCGDSGSSPPRKPDTGAGAGQTPPAVENCADLCQRLGTCLVILCNEDTMSTMYTGFDTLLAEQCTATCTDAQVMTAINPTAWQCFFQSSCRQVFDYDSCHAQGTYHCM